MTTAIPLNPTKGSFAPARDSDRERYCETPTDYSPPATPASANIRAGRAGRHANVDAHRPPVELLALWRQLHDAESLANLFARASEAARAQCGFSRALVVAVDSNVLRPTPLDALHDAASDVLRRRLLAKPVTLEPGTVEADFITRAEGGRGTAVGDQSLLQRHHGLERFALGAIIPEDRVLALLVVDRPWPPVDATDRRLVQEFASMLSSSVEMVTMRQRMTEFTAELRYMLTSAQALLAEGLSAPIALTVGQSGDPRLAQPGPLAPRRSDNLRDLFTRREFTVAHEIVAGRSNRQIAAALNLSPETVKKYVSRVMRKVGAVNRADAAVRCMRLVGDAG